MKGFIEIIGRNGKPRLINVRYIEEVTEIDNSHCEIYIHGGSEAMTYRFIVDIPYWRVVEMIKEVME